METPTKKKRHETKAKKAKKNAELNEAFLNLPRAKGYNTAIKNKIMKACNVTQVRFYNWTRSMTLIPSKDRKIISEIMDIPESELFPRYKKETSKA